MAIETVSVTILLTHVIYQFTHFQMIRSFRSKALKRFAETGDGSKLSVQNADRTRRILLTLNVAKTPEALNLPGFRFHGLKGNAKGRFALDASGNCRITFGTVQTP